MNKLFLLICSLCFSLINGYSQEVTSHNIKVEIENNAFMCPNLNMKIKRTLIQRQAQISDWKVALDYNSATFTTTNSSLCNKDSIIKIFVKESEYPFHIIKSIQVDNVEVHTKGNTNR